jgi:L-glyceraldehyde 3-phosphate reductase
MLTNKYLGGIPEGSRAAKPNTALNPDRITDQRLDQVRRLNDIAQARGQNMAQLAVTWVLRRPTITSALIGTSRPQQIEEIVAVQENLTLSAEEKQAIEAILAE